MRRIVGLFIVSALVSLGADRCEKREGSAAGGQGGSPEAAETIEYERTGGIAGFRDRTVIHRDGTVRVYRGDALVGESKIDQSRVTELEDFLRRQKFETFRAAYGRPGAVADAMTERLILQTKSGRKEVTVNTDTGDPPPAAFQQIVQRFQEAARGMSSTVEAEGVIQEQGITTYQYGTHVLQSGGRTLYALTSKSVKLGDYVGKQVRVSGTKVPGYPVDGGPEYLDVSRVVEVK